MVKDIRQQCVLQTDIACDRCNYATNINEILLPNLLASNWCTVYLSTICLDVWLSSSEDHNLPPVISAGMLCSNNAKQYLLPSACSLPSYLLMYHCNYMIICHELPSHLYVKAPLGIVKSWCVKCQASPVTYCWWLSDRGMVRAAQHLLPLFYCLIGLGLLSLLIGQQKGQDMTPSHSSNSIIDIYISFFFLSEWLTGWVWVIC